MVSLDWAPFPMSSTQLNPWQVELWEQAILSFVSIRDLTISVVTAPRGPLFMARTHRGQTPGGHQKEQNCSFIPSVCMTLALNGRFPYVHQDPLAWGAVEEGDKDRGRQHSEQP